MSPITEEQTALNLDKMLKGDSTYLSAPDRQCEINKQFMSLFPKPAKTGREMQYSDITREQVQKILIQNNLVREGANPEDAVNQALEADYVVDRSTAGYEGTGFHFVKKINGNSQEIFQLIPFVPIYWGRNGF